MEVLSDTGTFFVDGVQALETVELVEESNPFLKGEKYEADDSEEAGDVKYG